MAGPTPGRIPLLLLRRSPLTQAAVRSRILQPSSLSICPSCSRRFTTTVLPPYSKSTKPKPSSLFRSPPRRNYSSPSKYENPADDPSFKSALDQPPRLVRSGRKHNPWGLLILALIPATAFALGTWQVFRLDWKTAMIAKYEDRLARPPLPLPPKLDESAIPDFDYRKIVARGVFRHDQEMLIGPRLHDGTNGYVVITPLDRSLDGASTILVNRGWISKEMADKRKRYRVGGERALPSAEVLVEGLLREAPVKNMFTPDNNIEKGEFYFPDVKQMAGLAGSQEVLVEETMEYTILGLMDREHKGIPIGRVPEVNIRNNHFQYIVTWYTLGIATTIMFYLVVRRPPRDITKKVRLQKDWA